MRKIRICKCGAVMESLPGSLFAQGWWCDECGRLIQRNRIPGEPDVHENWYAPKKWFKGNDPE